MKKWKIVLLTILLLWLVSYIVASFFKDSKINLEDKIAVIPIYGPITISGSSSFIIEESGSSSNSIIEFLDKANSDSSVKAIILEIDSPGGTVVASEELANAVKSSNKPTVALIREVGASGAYWVASSANKIIASPMSITGSIGVLGSYLEFSEIFEKYGITYQELTAGELKEIGSPFKPLTPKEREIIQKKINLIHDYFIDEVSRNRNLSVTQIQEIRSGLFYLGREAIDLGLVDYLGNKDLAINVSKELAGIKEAKIITYERKVSFLDIFSKLSANQFYYIGRGIGASMYIQAKGNGFSIRT